MAFEKKQTFYVVIGADGARDITDLLPVNSGRLERTVEATSELAAYKEALGELPKLDPGIRELVILLNEIPGIRTWSSCEGHKRDKDPCATIFGAV